MTGGEERSGRRVMEKRGRRPRKGKGGDGASWDGGGRSGAGEEAARRRGLRAGCSGRREEDEREEEEHGTARWWREGEGRRDGIELEVARGEERAEEQGW